MNLDYLRYFVEVCDCGSIMKASAKLFISPQGLGQGIQRLEKSIGLKLLDRTAVGVCPTEFGKLFYEQATRVNTELDKLDGLAEKYTVSKKNTVTLGTIGKTKFYNGFMECVANYKKLHPDSCLKFDVIQLYEGTELLSAIKEGNLDVGLMFHFRLYDAFAYYHLSDFSPLTLLVSKDSPLSRKESVRWEELTALRYIVAARDDPFADLMEHMCQAHGFEPENVYYSTENSLNASLIDNNYCAMFVRESYKSMILHFCHNTADVPIEPEVKISNSLFWKKNRSFEGERGEFFRYMLSYLDILRM